MKADVHPNYYVAAASCACGAAFTTRSTKKEIKLEICSACHPFFTGKQRLVDSAGRVERFQKRFAKTEGKTIVREAQTEVKKVTSVPQGTNKKLKTLSTAPKVGKDDEKKAAAKKKTTGAKKD
ncbi:MAG: 50S ribosomal protein L31 [Elusimicrobia bacterium]|nr:50S ribosomal protein L31 [Elusimicrobiota bacterium]